MFESILDDKKGGPANKKEKKMPDDADEFKLKMHKESEAIGELARKRNNERYAKSCIDLLNCISSNFKEKYKGVSISKAL